MPVAVVPVAAQSKLRISRITLRMNRALNNSPVLEVLVQEVFTLCSSVAMDGDRVFPSDAFEFVVQI